MKQKVQPISEPTLFEIGKLDKAADLISGLNVVRPYSEPNLYLGTSAFTAAGWQGSFYPKGMQPREYLSHYAKTFRTVEIDSTFYGTPSASTVTAWNEKTPDDFVFAAKVPQIITHEKVLVDCEPEFDEFIDRMNLLGAKLGPLVLQFPLFSKSQFKAVKDFLPRLRVFFQFDMVTADFVYVRWLGDRKAIEAQTTTWDKTVIDRSEDLKNWVELFRQFMRRDLKIYAYANNHYAGNGPGTVRLFWEILNRK